MITKKELRIGNILHYTTEEGYVLPTTMDWQDLKWISEDPKGFNAVHEPIPLTDKVLEKSGFDKRTSKSFSSGSMIYYNIYSMGDLLYNSIQDNWWWHNRTLSTGRLSHLHQLQNLYHALTGEELEVGI